MKTVLAFGDSLTWGAIPGAGGRHAHEVRWPNVVAAALGPDVEVITDGLRGRHTAYDMQTSVADCNGAGVLPTVLSTHAPIDLVVIMLGTNDVVWGRSAAEARRGMSRLIEVIRHHPMRLPQPHVPQVLVVSPPPPMETAENPELTPEIARQSNALAGQLAAEAELQGVAFFDAGSVAQVSPLDGFHLDAENTRALGQALIAPIKALL